MRFYLWKDIERTLIFAQLQERAEETLTLSQYGSDLINTENEW